MRSPAADVGASASTGCAAVPSSMGHLEARPRGPRSSGSGCRASPPPTEEDWPLPGSPHLRGGAPCMPALGASRLPPLRDKTATTSEQAGVHGAGAVSSRSPSAGLRTKTIPVARLESSLSWPLVRRRAAAGHPGGRQPEDALVGSNSIDNLNGFGI